MSELGPVEIARACASYFGTSPERMRGAGRLPREVRARQVAMFLCRSRLTLSYSEIGRRFKKDHTTVITACKRVEESSLRVDAAEVLRQVEGNAVERAWCESCGQMFDRDRVLLELRAELRRLEARLEAAVKVRA